MGSEVREGEGEPTVPTGFALRDAREQLFGAAERVLLRDGPGALTSRAVTTELGVAKGVLHRHFADFDTFLAELVRDRIARLLRYGEDLRSRAGHGSVVGNLSVALTEVFDPVELALVGLIISRDGLRAQLRETTPAGIPLVAEVVSVLSGYLAAERQRGRIRPDADVATLAMTLVGTAHLLFAGELGALPDASAVEEVVASIIVGAEPGRPGGAWERG
jgi:AcrR family transcriptional regulator